MPQRVVDVWWAYYQCEPFGREWEQSASIMSMLYQHTAMTAATRGIKCEPAGVLDFMPSDSVPWEKRKKRRKRVGITDGKMQHLMIKQSFGFFGA